MRYSIEPRGYRLFDKGYRLLSFAKNMAKNLSNNYREKLLDSAKKSTTDWIKTVSKRAIQKTAEVTGDFIRNKIADKITSVSKSPKELYSNELLLKSDENETDIPKERYISAKKRQTIIEELRLV